MGFYLLKRILLMVPTLFGVMLITFCITQFVPGGPVEKMISQLQGVGRAGAEVASGPTLYQGGSGLDREKIEQLKKLYGFDQPPVVRFVQMMKKYLIFDFGSSYYYHRSVVDLVISKMPVSMSLGLWSFVVVYGVCIPLGIKKAIRHGSRFDLVSSTVILIGYAIPGFVLGVLLIVLFGGGSFWSVFPLRGLVSENWSELSVTMKVLDYLWHMVMPITASAVGSLAVMTMLTKNSFLEEIRKQYVITARAKGLGEGKVLYKHVFRNGIIPIITGFPGYFIASFFTGSLLIETIFSLDGMGLLAYRSVLDRDYPVVLGTLYFFTIIGLISRLLSDLSYVVVDPRISFEAIDE
ncbi:microcin C ABC transporter permease YejB [Desulforhopalus singaporensis]|uniref:Microcin C transport system permease protein n=1 Tax=Desulforhopalus singaporensis TaxID=91360 RepID=A0A1H0ML90_9BACT|nr:ABC transporter permease subunit [Desulforhopalus singaporensis]SDO81172.1 microcin C transport system permease protein [Desulforhopalus singaporensis]